MAGLRIELRSRMRHGWHRIGWRLAVGRAWHGQEVDEDKWTWPGPWFWRMSQPKRAAVRWAFFLLLCLTAAGWLADPGLTAELVRRGVIVAAVLAVIRAVNWAQDYRFRRTWVRPLHLAAHELAGHGRTGPLSWIELDRDRTTLALRLPQGWIPNAAAEKELVAVAMAKTGIESQEVTWRRGGPAPMVTLSASQPPPARVALADVRRAIEAARADEPVWGVGRHGQVVKSSLSGDSPHLGLSMGSGAGKSVTARAIAAQMLFHGANVLIIDYKMISHQWARDLPNVAIVRRPREIHAAMLWLGAEAERRNEVALAGSDMDGNVHAVVGARLMVICEELNATMSKLRAYWRMLRNVDRTLPQRSPALEAIDAVNLMGRQVLMNLVYMGQRLSVKAIGGDGDARESIGVIAFGRYSASNWKMLAGDFAMPPKSLTPGRIQVVSDRVQETQAVFMSAMEARELALAGTVTPCPAGMPGAASVAAETHQVLTAPEQGLSHGTATLLAPPSGLVSLRQAVDEGIVSRKLHAVRKASQRDPDFPRWVELDGTTRKYRPLDLIAWDES